MTKRALLLSCHSELEDCINRALVDADFQFSSAENENQFFALLEKDSFDVVIAHGSQAAGLMRRCYPEIKKHSKNQIVFVCGAEEYQQAAELVVLGVKLVLTKDDCHSGVLSSALSCLKGFAVS